MKQILVSIAKKCGYVFAALVILAALVVAVSRLLTPYVDARRTEIESIASNLLGSPVVIENAGLSWFQYHPGVALRNVTILDKTTKEPVLQIDTVKVFISIPQSIWQRKLVARGMLVSGAELVVDQSASGEFVIQGFPAIGGYDTAPYKSESRFKDVSGWLSMQPLLILRDIDVRYTGINGKKRFLTLMNLRLENTSDQHKILGRAILHQDISTELVVAAQWQGQVTEPEKINGKIYLNVSGMSLAQWFQGLVFKAWEIKKGLVSTKIWAEWRDGGFQQIQSTFQLLDVNLHSGTDDSTRKISRLSGDLGWKKQGNDQILAGDDILVDWATHLWPVTSFYIKLTPDAKQQLVPVLVNIGFIDLADLREILNSSPKFLPEQVVKALDELKPVGNLENISIALASEKDQLLPVSLQGRFSRLQLQSMMKLPAVENLSGTFNWKNASGALSLRSRKALIRYPSLFDNPLLLDQLTGDILWQQDENKDWKITLKSMGILNADFALNMGGQLSLPVKAKPSVDIAANFTVHNISHIRRYLPVKAMHEDLVKWMKNAFVAGVAQSGALFIKGALADFPFDHNNGVFNAAVAVNNVQLHYADDWPDLKNISAKVQINGRRLMIDADRMQVLGIDIGRAHGDIPDLGSPKSVILTVYSTPIHTDFSHGMNFLHQSPLEKTIGKMFTNVEMHGPIELILALTVPLDHPGDTEVKGVIEMQNDILDLVPWKLSITKMNGGVNFTERSTNAKDIQGLFFDKPLTLDIGSIKKAGETVVRATVNTIIDLKDIQTWLKLPVDSVATGSSKVTTKLDLAVDKPIEIDISSDLTGIALDLPEQYAKTAAAARNFTANLFIEDKHPLKLKLNYADLLNAALIMDRVKDQFDLIAADLRIGKGDVTWPEERGLYITGKISDLNTEKIKKYLALSGTGTHAGMQLKLIDLEIDNMDLSGIKLTKSKLQLTPDKSVWTINITSEEVIGKIDVPVNFNADGILNAELKYIDLDALSSHSTANSTALIPKSLPAINFFAKQVDYSAATLNNVRLITQPKANGLTIKSLNIRSQDISLQASGEWTQSAAVNSTSLRGGASSQNVSALLANLGFNVHNFIASNADVDFDLNWNDSPLSLSLANMSGSASIEMGKGRIVEVSQASDAKMDIGRMLNLFSLQSIPRRLTGDFSDIFMKGYSFDTLKGDFTFSRGDANTSNMRFDGTLARIDIRGRIGLAKKDFDLVLSVTPYVTSSIPVAATLLTGQPVIGLAAWAVNKMISSEVSKVATYYYSVSGSWATPVWNTIDNARER